MNTRKQTYCFFTLIILSLCGYMSVQAQSALYVYDAYSLEPLVYATVKYTDSQDKISYNTTDDLGASVIPFQDISTVEVSYIGYQSITKTVDKNAHLKKIYLYPIESAIDEVVITGASAEEQASESMYRIEVLKKENLENTGANNLRDALLSQPNIKIEQDGVLGSTISLQGMGGSNVKIMIDGVPVAGRVNGNIDISQINLNNVERIEVVEGPMSVIYGTDAIAGVVNLITKSSQKNNWEGNINSYYESIGTYNIDANIGYKKGKHLLQVNGGRYFFDGWNDGDYDRNVEWDPKEQYFGGLTYVYRTKNDWFNRFKINYYSDKILNRKNPTGAFPVAFDDWFKTKRADIAYIANGKVKNNLYLNATTSYNFYQRISEIQRKDLTTLETNIQESNTDYIHQWMSRGIFTFKNDTSKAHYQFGYDIKVENGQGERFKRENGKSITLGEIALFSAIVWQPTSHFSIQPAVRYGYHSKYIVIPTPSLSIKANFGNDFTYRLSYGMGFRSPSLKELYMNFVDKNHRIFGNENLSPELSHNINTSLSYDFTKGIHRLSTRANFFFNHKFDAISLLSSSSNATEFHYTNIGQYQTMGTRIEMGYYIKDFTINTAFGYYGKHNKSQNITNQKFRFAPEITAGASYDIKRIGLNISANSKWIGKQNNFVVDSETNEISSINTAAYNLLNISASKSFWEKRIKLTVGAKNLMNVTSIDNNSQQSGGAHNSANGALISTGRSFYVGLKIGGKL